MAWLSSTKKKNINDLVDRHGDLVFDLCNELLVEEYQVRKTFRNIIKDVKKSLRKNTFEDYERAWILRVACRHLLKDAKPVRNQLTPEEKLTLDTNTDPEQRLNLFALFLQRLPVQEQLLLLLREKHGIDYSEIGSALSIPESSLKTKRGLAIRTLEEWIWENQ